MILSEQSRGLLKNRKGGDMYKRVLKRFFDIASAVMALPLFLIILFIIGPAIYFEDKGPVFYNAPRLGKDGRIFKMYKFRSMKTGSPDIRNKDGSTFNSEDDMRLTRIGKFLRKTSLDETPQIINILKNDMSVIGPRPDLPEHLFAYEGDEERKLKIKPGITGYNQAFFRNTIPWKERIRNDIFYLDNLSIWLDIKILFRTVVSVAVRKNIYIKDQRKNGEVCIKNEKIHR